MRKKSFTLIELIIVLIIVGGIITVAIPLYHNVVEKAKAKVCEANLKVLAAAVEIYALENDQLPGSLGQLQPQHLRKAWAQIFKEEDEWKIKLAYFIVDFDNRGLAYASSNLLQRYLGGDIKLITCPSDPTPPPQGTSYGINCALAGMSYRDYKNLPDSYIVVGDCETSCFHSLWELSFRHKRYFFYYPSHYAHYITKARRIFTQEGYGYGGGYGGE